MCMEVLLVVDVPVDTFPVPGLQALYSQARGLRARNPVCTQRSASSSHALTLLKEMKGNTVLKYVLLRNLIRPK